MTVISVRAARATDRDAIASLLRVSSLPLDGIDDAEFVVALHGARMIGCAGIETRGGAVLLRSVAVAPAARGLGAGDMLVRWLLDQVAARGLSPVVLLTTTASAWFPRFGFAPIARDGVPAPLLDSAEFHGACPDTAVIMRRD